MAKDVDHFKIFIDQLYFFFWELPGHFIGLFIGWQFIGEHVCVAFFNSSYSLDINSLSEA